MKVRFDAAGVPTESLREKGRGVLQMRPLSTQVPEGGGLALHASKRGRNAPAPPPKKD